MTFRLLMALLFALVGVTAATPASATTAHGQAIVEGTFTLETTPPNPVVTDKPVMVTLTAMDENGSPWSGLTVEFFSTHVPDGPVAVTDTDASGRASYTYEPGECDFEGPIITAVVRDVEGAILTQLNVEIVFPPYDPGLYLTGGSSGRHDWVEVDVTRCHAGAEVVVTRERRDGTYASKRGIADADGKVRFRFLDRNGQGKTTYSADSFAVLFGGRIRIR